MSPFSFSLFHTLIVFLSIFFELHLQLKLSLFCVLLSLELTHNGQEWLSVLLQLPLGLSTTRLDSTNCPEPDHLHPKPPDQSLVSVGCGSLAHGPESNSLSCELAV